MIIEPINNFEEFEQLENNWQAVHQRDPYAHIFSSWAWLRGYITSTPFDWIVLAITHEPSAISFSVEDKASDNGLPTSTREVVDEFPYCGFIFLTLESKALNSWRILRLGGSPMADYTGFVCLAGLEQGCLTAAARFIKDQLCWDQFHLWDVLDPRLEYLTFHLDSANFTMADRQKTPCPYIDLPSKWDDFLQTKLSKTVRKKVRRRTTQVQELEKFRIITVEPRNLVSQIDTLFDLWSQKWQQPADEGLRPIFHQLSLSKNLWLTTLWDDAEPIAGLAGFVDYSKSTFYAFMGAYNNDYEKLSPGIVLDGYSLRFAMENELTRYDYLRGDHEYKFRWGAENRTVPRLEIIRKSARTSLMAEVIRLSNKLKSF